MSNKMAGSALMFDAENIRRTTAFLPRLIRLAFLRFQITNDSYLNRYWENYRSLNPLKTRKEFSQKSTADRKFLSDKDKLSINMLLGIMRMMGFNVRSIAMEVEDNLTGEVVTISTSDTVDDILAQLSKDNQIGISSII